MSKRSNGNTVETYKRASIFLSRTTVFPTCRQICLIMMHYQWCLSDTESIRSYETPPRSYGSELYYIDGRSESSDEAHKSLWNTSPLGIVKGPPGLKSGKVTLEGPKGSGFPTLRLGESCNLDLGKPPMQKSYATKGTCHSTSVG